MSTSVPGPLPLDGVNVLDLTQYLSGPYCTMLLADLGARVVKLESPSRGGDPVRHAGGASDPTWGSTAFRALNRNKESVELELDGSPEVVAALARWADVVVENFRPGVTEKLGISYEDFRRVDPDIVYGTIRGYRSAGPLGDRGGFDIIAQGMSGLMSVTGVPGGTPCKVGVPITDVAAGTNLAVALLAALTARRGGGGGRHVEATLMESGMAFGVWEVAEVWDTGAEPGPLGSAHRAYAPYQAIRAADGYLTLGVMGDDRFAALCELLGREELATDERFETNAVRVRNREALIGELESAAGDWAADELVDRLNAIRIPAGRVLSFPDALEHPQSQAGDMVWEVEVLGRRSDRGLSSPVTVDGRALPVRAPAPRLGEHTESFYAEVGLG